MAGDNPNIKVTADTSQATSALDKFAGKMSEVSKKVNSFSKSMQNSGKKIQDVGDKMFSFGAKVSASVSLPLLGVAKSVITVGSEYQSLQSTMSTVYGKMEGAVDSYTAKFSKSVGFHDTLIKQAMFSVYRQQKALGASSEEALKYSEAITPVLTDLSAMYNIPLDETFNRFTSAVSGNYEALDSLGLNMSDTYLKSLMVSKGLKGNVSDLDATTRANLIAEGAMKQGAHARGQASKESEQFSVKLQNLKQDLTELAEKYYSAVEPAVIKLVDYASKLVDWFGKLSPKTQEIIGVMVGVGIVLAPIIMILGGLAMSIGAIISVAGILFGVLFSWIGLFILIGIAIGVFAYEVVKHWDDIKKKTGEIWQAVKDKISSVVDGIKDKFKAGVDKIKGIINNMKTAWNNGVNSIKQTASSILSAITSPFKKAWSTISGIFSKIKSGFKSAFDFQLPHIKLPHFSIDGKFSLNPPQIPKIGVNWNAKGGVFTEPTVLQGVGEAGDEAVLPLKRNVLAGIGKGIAQSMPSGTVNKGKDVTIENTYNISAIIREEADINRLATRITELQEKLNRAEGTFEF